MFSNIILPVLALVSRVFAQTDISNLAGPFRLVTTASTAVPVVPTSYLELYCEKDLVTVFLLQHR